MQYKSLLSISQVAILIFFSLCCATAFAVQTNDNIKIQGYVTDQDGPLHLANIIVKGTTRGTTTNEKGYFTIKVRKTDIVLVSFLGKKEVILSAFTKRVIFVNMVDDTESILDEVAVNAKKEETVTTSFGKTTKRSSGFYSKTLNKSEFNKSAIYLKDLIRGRFILPTAQTISGETNALFVLDGVPLGQQSPSQLDWIDISQIEELYLLRSVQATARYGTLGVNGAIEIITVNNPNLVKKRLEKNYTTKFDEKTITLSALEQPTYMSGFTSLLSSEAAYQLYEAQQKIHFNNIDFYVDMYDFFGAQNDIGKANEIFSKAATQFHNNKEALKAMVYKYQEKGDHAAALILLERIAILSPESIQAYRDMAQGYHFKGEHRKAFKIYSAVLRNPAIAKSTHLGLKKTFEYELENLVNKHRSLLDVSKIDEKYLKRENIVDYRITFEWNDYDAEFNLQVVDPKKHHFTWEHSFIGDPERIKKEKILGYGIEENSLTKKDKGSWYFNLEYTGHSQKNEGSSLYVKMTIFENYGKANETKTIQVVRLRKMNQNVTVANLEI